MNKTQKTILVVSVIIGFIVLGGAFTISTKRGAKQQLEVVAQHPVSKAELAKADGRDGRNCYVAVDGAVYLIKDFSLWQSGQHTTSNGLAYCGADLSKVIDRAPHGRKILDLLTKVGPLSAS